MRPKAILQMTHLDTSISHPNDIKLREFTGRTRSHPVQDRRKMRGTFRAPFKT